MTTSRAEALEHLLQSVCSMRRLQREYFKSRQRTTLAACRDMERRVDAETDAIMNRQGDLFPAAGQEGKPS